MSGKERRKIAQNQVFHIKIGPHAEKLNVKDPAFLKILQQEYATRYLENLGVEPTLKNIHRVLKDNPIENCDIIQSRLNGGLHTDTLTIITKKAEDLSQKKVQKQNISGQMLQVLNLKPMRLKKDGVHSRTIGGPELQKKQKVGDKEEVNLEMLSFDIREMKEIYIFPFNLNFRRQSNYKLKDNNNLLDVDSQDSKVIYQARIFHFPFTQVKLSIKVLKELQTPVHARLSDIMAFLDKYYQEFPFSIFPMASDHPMTRQHPTLNSFLKAEQRQPERKREQTKNSYLSFQQRQIDRAFQLVKSQQNAKMIGVFMHLAYWSVFGGVNPIQVDQSMKKKMYTMMVETLEYFEIKMQSKKNWTVLGFPLILLTLKMATHYFFALQYPRLFRSEETIKSKANELALDKLLFFVEKLFDQGNLNGRFIFLESDIDGEKGNFIKDKKFIRKRIFGTSPALNLVLTDPKNGKTRSIMAKNMQIDQQDGTINDNKYIKDKEIDPQSRQKLLNLALHKIKARIEDLNGGPNPIVNLQDS